MKREKLAPSEPLLKAKVLGQKSDARPSLPVAERLPENEGVASGRPREAEQHLHRRRLPGAVRTEEAEDLTPTHGQGEVVDCKLLAEPLPQSACVDREISHCGASSPSGSRRPRGNCSQGRRSSRPRTTG